MLLLRNNQAQMEQGRTHGRLELRHLRRARPEGKGTLSL